MPSDPNIILGIRPPAQAESPLATIGALQQIRTGQIEQSLRQQQVQTAQAQQALVQQETDTKNRENSAWNKIAEIGKNPDTAKAIGAGDFSALDAQGIDPRILNTFKSGVLEQQKNIATKSTADLTLHGSQLASLTEGFNGLKTLAKDHPEQLPGAYAQYRNTAIGLKLVGPDTLPASIASADDLDTIAAKTGFFQGMHDKAQSDAKAAQELKTAASTEAMNNAHAADFSATAAKTNALTPLEVAEKTTENAQKSRVLAGTSPTGITAEQAATNANQRITANAAASNAAINAKKFAVEFGGDAVKGWAKQVADNPDTANSVPPALRTAVSQQFTSETGLPFPKPLSGPAVDQERAAHNALKAVQQISEALKDPEIQSRRGAVLGRIGNAEQDVGATVGLSDSAATKAAQLRSNLRYLFTQELKANIGGRPPVELARALEAVSPNIKESDPLMQGSLNGVKDAALRTLDSTDEQRFGAGKTRTREARGLVDAKAGPVTVQTPHGAMEFKDQKTADAYKKEAGLP